MLARIRKEIGASRRLAFVFLVASVFAPADAQVSTASITGIIRDSSGSAIPDATIILKNPSTGIDRTTTSNALGNYAFVAISPGTYLLISEKSGFATSTVQPFTLGVSQTATFDLTLSVGGVQQSVTVQAAGAAIEAATAELGSLVSNEQVVDLPLNGRNFTQLLALNPWTSPSAVGAVTFPAINGATNRSNFFMMDGITDTETMNNTYVIPPIIDTIQEFKVISHVDQAEYGGVTGGYVNVVTKSGTNALHGSAWEFLRNDQLDARNFFQPSVTPLRWNQFGASGGGPVVLPKLYNGRNRTFFYLGYQGFRLRQPANSYFRVPTSANLSGDMSDWPTQIYDPWSTQGDPKNPGQFTRNPFPGNQIPVSRLDPGMVLFAKTVLPAPIFTGVSLFNGRDTTPFQQNQEEYNIRIDQNLGSKDFAWFRYSGVLADTIQSGGVPGLVQLNPNRGKNFGFDWVHTFGPSSTLQVQFGRVRTGINFNEYFSNLPVNFIQDVGFSNNFAGNYGSGTSIVPLVSVANYFNNVGGQYNPTSPTQVWQTKANYSKIIGGHIFKLGGEFNKISQGQVSYNSSLGFAAPQSADPENLGNTGSALASFLLDVPDSAARNSFHQTVRFGGEIGFYFQDQWKVTPRLTVNLGLRYDRTFVPPIGAWNSKGQNGGIETGEMDYNNGTYILQVVPPTCAERGYAPCIPDPSGKLPDHVVVDPRGKIYHDTTKNFQPRVGIAYRLNATTAIRSSFGIFFDNWAGITQTSANYEGSWPDIGSQQEHNLNYPSSANPQPTITGKQPFLTGTLPAPTPYNQQNWFMDPYAKNPYSMQWNFGIQHQLGSGTVANVNYVGSSSRRLDVGTYYNVALTPGPGDPQARSLFPYLTPSWYDKSIGRGNYNALQVSFEKRFSNGLSALASYTWSKSLDIGCSGWYGVEGCSVQDPYHIDRDRSVSGFDLTNIFNLSWVYELPVGPGKLLHTGNRITDLIIGNWQINGIVQYHSGIPYDVGVSGDIANTGNSGSQAYGYERLNLIGNPRSSNPTVEQWLNPAAFAVPAQYTFGNLGRFALRTQGSSNWDVSLFRQLSLKEKYKLELRGEAFNLFNHPVFGVPVTDFNQPNFGAITSTANTERRLQIGGKILF